MRILNMKIATVLTVTRKELNNDKGGGGLEIYIPGVFGDPADVKKNKISCPIFIEEYKGEVFVRIWNGEQDPTSIKLTNVGRKK